MQGPAAQEPHTAQAIESGASFMAAVTDATAPMPGMEGDPSQAQQVRAYKRASLHGWALDPGWPGVLRAV